MKRTGSCPRCGFDEGLWARFLAESLGVSAADLAKYLGVSTDLVYKWRRAERMPSADTLAGARIWLNRRRS